MEIRLLESAQQDLREGHRFYETQSPDSASIFSIASRPM